VRIFKIGGGRAGSIRTKPERMSHDEERVSGRRFGEDEEVALDSDGLPLLAMVRKPLGDPVITVRHLSKRTSHARLCFFLFFFKYYTNKYLIKNK
jgi:hypothetical protein